MDGAAAAGTRAGTEGPAARVEVRKDETVEQYVMRVCEERVAALHKHGEGQIALFLAEAQAMKASAMP